MKSFILMMCFVFMVGIAFAAIKTGYVNTNGTDQLVTSSNLQLVDASIYFKGAAVGDAIVLKNGTTSAGKTFLTVITAAANGSYFFMPSEPIQLDGGIYMDGSFTTGTTTSGATLMIQ